MTTASIPLNMPAPSSKREIHFLRLLSLKGPNIWTYRAVIEAWVDIGNLEDEPSNLIPGFTERLTAWLPSLIEHHCSPGHRGGFISRLHEGTWAGHVLEHVTLELQSLAGMPTGFGRAREMEQRGVYKVIVRAFHETVTLRALELARDLIVAAMDDRSFDVTGAIETLRDLAETHLLGPSTQSIVSAADERNIPALRMNHGNLVQLGYGHAQRRIWTAETDQTSAIAETISRDKALTKTLLQQAGIPIPEGQLVHSAAEAWETAQEIGLPVVVKPLRGNHGRAVFTHLYQQAEIETAYHIAFQEDDEVLVERHIAGLEHRLLVVGDKLIAAARGEVATIIGDGISTICHLIDCQINIDPRRGETEAHPLNRVRVDSACLLELHRQGYDSEHNVPALGAEIIIQRVGNVAADVTPQVHPDTIATAILAAKVIGLDIAGIDLVVQDISCPLASQQGAIVEVNAGPGLLMHLKPAQGEARPVGSAIVNHLFPPHQQGRIPIIAVSGYAQHNSTALLIAHLLRLNMTGVALATQQGLWLDQRQIASTSHANYLGAERVLRNPASTVAVLELDNTNILEQGLGFDRCQITVVTDIDHHADFNIYAMNTRDKRLMLARTPIDVVLPKGAAILSAEDELIVELAQFCDGEVIYFTEQPETALITQHLAQGGRAVIVYQHQIQLRQKDAVVHEISLSQLPTVHTTIRQTLAAIACVWAMDMSIDIILAGLISNQKEY